MQHVDALHDDKGLQHVHLELQRLFAKVVEVGEGRCEKFPQHLSFLGGSFLQPSLNIVKMGFFPTALTINYCFFYTKFRL